ncbi:hypothetical protein QWZ03_07780 [Chitinimonas viridis]|uniref:Tryptophan 2,3-dioxygenase n=1 Tax=Chitinimonas viridis TaxID=664880 RepID=A0ABT8B577_9NEIS|nr:hypothetical protein [Chitinimonas viridis]MDN3576659.1 hypothetical protein [Chitinimonas viridis]
MQYDSARPEDAIAALSTAATAAEVSSKATMDRLVDWAQAPTRCEFPYLAIVDAYHCVGKHFVSPDLLAALNTARTVLDQLDPPAAAPIRAFLNMALDKYDGTYDYRSYIALDLLPLPRETILLDEQIDPQARLDRLVFLLVIDLARFEIDAFEGKARWLPKLPTNEQTMQTRCARTLKALQPYLQRLGLADLVESIPPASRMATLCNLTQQMMSPEERLYLQLTNVPVSLVHDEYMFIRTLQTFETVFVWVSAKLRLAIEVGVNNLDSAIQYLDDCARHLQEAAPFFHVLSTLKVESFADFRTYTEGASAIQSRSYKRVESLCSKPSPERLHSIAYDSVPDVQQQVQAGGGTLNDLYLAIQASGRSPEDATRLADAMQRFESTLLQWRRSHYGIALTMLGKGTGTGYTAGTPYLDEVRNLPVFTALNAAASIEG